jgi:hypothetical protein
MSKNKAFHDGDGAKETEPEPQDCFARLGSPKLTQGIFIFCLVAFVVQTVILYGSYFN